MGNSPSIGSGSRHHLNTRDNSMRQNTFCKDKRKPDKAAVQARGTT
jgi:hypothetical protein